MRIFVGRNENFFGKKKEIFEGNFGKTGFFLLKERWKKWLFSCRIVWKSCPWDF
jgi:hypothetical protein